MCHTAGVRASRSPQLECDGGIAGFMDITHAPLKYLSLCHTDPNVTHSSRIESCHGTIVPKKKEELGAARRNGIYKNLITAQNRNTIHFLPSNTSTFTQWEKSS